MLKSPVAYLTDAQFSALPFSERILHVAASQVGTLEATGHNDGEVDKYLQAAGMGKGSKLAYCASGVYWSAIGAGGKMQNFPPKGDCAAVRNWRIHFSKLGLRKEKPSRGMAFYWTNGNDKLEQGHIGLIVRSALGLVYTIEFNTNGEGSREGNGVHRRIRTVASIKKQPRWGFIHFPDDVCDGTK